MQPTYASARAHCYTCDKVACLCLCAHVVTVQNRTAITIVQHPRERRHPLGTARIARLGLENFSLHVTKKDTPLRFPAGAAVLFPDPNAPLLSELSAADRPTHLVVVDGTWGQASQLRRNHRALADLPAVRLAPDTPSRYRIRREPNAQAISTIEAIVRALSILEPDTPGLDGLLSSFDKMIDEHLERRGGRPPTPRHRHTARLRKSLPAVFRDASRPVVLIYAELHQPRGQTSRFPLRVTAARSQRGELVDTLVSSPFLASAGRIQNMGLGQLPLLDVTDQGGLARQLRALIDPADTLLAWAQTPEPMLRSLGFDQPFFSAKHHFARTEDGRTGSLEGVATHIGGPPLEPWAPGRAGWQLAYLDRVLASMRARLGEAS